MTEIPSALLEPSAPVPAPHGCEPPGSPPDTPFAAVLNDHRARTAVAEGHRRAEREPDAAPGASDGERASDATDRPEATTLAALLGGVPLPSDVPVVAASVPAAAVASAEPEPGGGRVLSDPVPPTQARTPASGGRTCILTATRPIGVPADAITLPLRPPVPGAPAEAATASSPSLPIGLGAMPAESRGDGLGAPATAPLAVARATRLADVLQAATARPAAPADPAATPAPVTVAGRAQSETSAHASAQAATPAAPATPASTSAIPATPATPPPVVPASTAADIPLPVRAVGLEHAVETVRLALRHGAERGVTHARISLTPRELGTVEVHLRQTAEGLVARVVAEHAGAVQQLQQAGAELRRSLESQGLTLLRLDIGASGDETAGRRGAAFDGAAAFGDDDRRRRDGADALAPLDGAISADAGEAVTTLQLPNGALVDVLA